MYYGAQIIKHAKQTNTLHGFLKIHLPNVYYLSPCWSTGLDYDAEKF